MPVCTERQKPTVGWDVFLPDILPYVRGVPDELAMHQVRETTIDFASRTGVIQREFYADLWKGVENYTFEVSDGYQVNLVRRVIRSRRTMPVLTDYPANPDAACGAYFSYPDTIFIFPPSDADVRDGLIIEASLVPSRDSCSLDREVYERFGKVIAEGAVSTLMLLKGTDWYNPADAPKFYRRYREGVNRAKVWIGRGNQAAPLTLKPKRPWI